MIVTGSSQRPSGVRRPDVAAGEYSWSLADSARLIEAGAVDCLQLDVTRCGGVTEFIRGAALAANTLGTGAVAVAFAGDGVMRRPLRKAK